MKRKGKEISIWSASRERVILRKASINFLRSGCVICGTGSEMLMLDSAVSVSGLSTLEILALIEANCIHCSETPNGHLVVCRRSLEAKTTNQFIAMKEADQKLLGL